MTAAEFVVVICTRNRGEHLAATLDALDAQTAPGHQVLVIDQSQAPDRPLREREARSPCLRVVPDAGVGLSRARNLAWRLVEADWLVYLDDDCRPEPGWAGALEEVLIRAGDVDVVSGHVSGGPPPSDGEYLEVTVFPVVDEVVLAGRWTPPWEIGFGVCMAVRRDTVERLGGWDERLGVGSAGPFGAGEDMDFNYRLLRRGGRALVTPTVRSSHEQWRPAAELAPLFERYMAGWSGFAMKHLRTGDVLGGLWLWKIGFVATLRMFASAGRRRSWLRFRVATAKLKGLVAGTAHGLRRRW